MAVDEGSVDVGNYAFLHKTKKSSKNPYPFSRAIGFFIALV